MSAEFWDWLTAGESGSTTIRNLGLVIAAAIGLPLAIWRSKVAERQAVTAQHQSETSQRQAETAQRSLLNERYQKGAEMLGSTVLSVRLGGIYALSRLAREHPEDYHVQIMSLLCAFVRHPTSEDVETPRGWKEEGNNRPIRVREDVQAVMTAVCERSKTQIEIEEEVQYQLDLSDADLNGVQLKDADLNGANLEECRSERCRIGRCASERCEFGRRESGSCALGTCRSDGCKSGRSVSKRYAS